MQAGLALQAGRQPKANPRFVVVKGGARRIYRRIYCQRGRWRTVSRNSRRGWRWTGRVARVFMRTSSACCCGGRLCLAAGVAVALGRPVARTQAATVPAEAGGVGEEFDAAGRVEPAAGGPTCRSGCRLRGVWGRCRLRGAGSGLTATGGEQRGGSVPNGGRQPDGRGFATPLPDRSRHRMSAIKASSRRDRKTGPKTV